MKAKEKLKSAWRNGKRKLWQQRQLMQSCRQHMKLTVEKICHRRKAGE